jgi:hypothetical protein
MPKKGEKKTKEEEQTPVVKVSKAAKKPSKDPIVETKDLAETSTEPLAHVDAATVVEDGTQTNALDSEVSRDMLTRGGDGLAPPIAVDSAAAAPTTPIAVKPQVAASSGARARASSSTSGYIEERPQSDTESTLIDLEETEPGGTNELSLALYRTADRRCSTCYSTIEGTDFVVKAKAGPENKHKVDVLKCGGCNRLATRVQKVLSQRVGLKDGWASLGPDERRQFYKENHLLLGTELAMQMDTTIRLHYTQKSSNSFAANGDWLDEDEVRTLYKDKPGQFESTIANARQMAHPVRRVTLYEVLVFKSASSREESNQGERVIAMSTVQHERAAKRKVAVKDKETAEEEKPKKIKAEKVSSLSAQQTDKLDKYCKTVEASIGATQHECKNLFDEFPDIPKIYHRNFALKEVEVMSTVAALNLAIATNQGKVKDLMGNAKKALTEFMDAAAKVITQASDLQAMGILPKCPDTA